MRARAHTHTHTPHHTTHTHTHTHTHTPQQKYQQYPEEEKITDLADGKVQFLKQFLKTLVSCLFIWICSSEAIICGKRTKRFTGNRFTKLNISPSKRTDEAVLGSVLKAVLWFYHYPPPPKLMKCKMSHLNTLCSIYGGMCNSMAPPPPPPTPFLFPPRGIRFRSFLCNWQRTLNRLNQTPGAGHTVIIITCRLILSLWKGFPACGLYLASSFQPCILPVPSDSHYYRFPYKSAYSDFNAKQ